MKFGSKLKVLSLTLCALMMVSAFSLTVSAAATLTVQQPTKADVSGTSLVQVTVPFTCSEVAQVTLLVVKGATQADFPEASESNIVYIDQMAAPAGGTGSFTFKVDKATLGTDTWLHIKVGGTSLDNPGVTVIEATTSICFGDVNGDTNVTAMDASLVLQKIAGTITSFPGNAAGADVNGDSNVSAMDASLILQKIAGIIASFPAEAK